MRIAALQHDIVWEDASATCARVEPMIAEAAADNRIASTHLLSHINPTACSLKLYI